MKTWNIPVVWQEMGVVKIEAETLADAIKIAIEDDNIPLPDNNEYLDGSWEVAYSDEEFLRSCYNGNQADDICWRPGDKFSFLRMREGFMQGTVLEIDGEFVIAHLDFQPSDGRYRFHSRDTRFMKIEPVRDYCSSGLTMEQIAEIADKFDRVNPISPQELRAALERSKEVE